MTEPLIDPVHSSEKHFADDLYVVGHKGLYGLDVMFLVQSQTAGSPAGARTDPPTRSSRR